MKNLSLFSSHIETEFKKKKKKIYCSTQANSHFSFLRFSPFHCKFLLLMPLKFALTMNLLLSYLIPKPSIQFLHGTQTSAIWLPSKFQYTLEIFFVHLGCLVWFLEMEILSQTAQELLDSLTFIFEHAYYITPLQVLNIITILNIYN